MLRGKLTRRTRLFALTLAIAATNVGLMLAPSAARAADEEISAGCQSCSKCSGQCEGGVRTSCFCCSGLCWRCGDAC